MSKKIVVILSSPLGLTIIKNITLFSGSNIGGIAISKIRITGDRYATPQTR